MSLWSRIANVFRADRISRELDQELQSHLAEAVEQGRDPAEARRAFGSVLRHREESQDIRLSAGLDALRSDVVFGWRQLMKARVSSAAAIISLALAMGACAAAFRLIDALLLRPLPVAAPERLFAVTVEGVGPDGKHTRYDHCPYPLFRQMRAAVSAQAELIAAGYSDRVDLSFGSDPELEKAQRQHVSGGMFGTFGLRPAAGRLLSEADDRTPGAHPYAVLSYDYWTRRFGQDPQAVGRTFRMGREVYEIVGVVEEKFTGTEPGNMVDVYVPATMHPFAARKNNSWLRALVHLRPGQAAEPVAERLRVPFRTFRQERVREGTGAPSEQVARYLGERLTLAPASAGVSHVQHDHRLALTSLGMLVALVLLIACVNVANLMTVRAAARAREMALRVSIGAGRSRLVQLVMMESAWIASTAAVLAGLFAWWAAPFVVGMINSPDNPARLHLPADQRVLGFGLALTFAVTVLFGLGPALRASNVKPASALKGGQDPHARPRLMHALIAAQVAFCCVVLFVGALLLSSYDRLARQPTGFSTQRLLLLETVTQQAMSPIYWSQVASHLRAVPGVERVSVSEWPLLQGGSWNGFISVNRAPVSLVKAQFLNVSPGWLDTMGIRLRAGRDLRPNDANPGVAVINEAFAEQYFSGHDPLGKVFERNDGDGSSQGTAYRVVGVVRNARYRDLREPWGPIAYFPLDHCLRASFVVRTASANPLAVAQTLRREVPRAHAGFRVNNIRTQQELVEMHTVRERLLAMLALFFAVVALVLAGVGLFGVLDYSVLQRRREIGIRLAVGAPAAAVVCTVTAAALARVVLGAAAGVLLGGAAERYLEALLFGVKATDPAALAVTLLALLGTALLAALLPALRAVRTDAVETLRSE
ncbi:MAG TPA: ADOP family duplicated permease [Bryobacteraceae bacterium]|nr:ADOP family duplicated permease [Bryobacteraceae bacterium]